MRLVPLLSLIPSPILRFLIPYVRLVDLRSSVESIIVEAWLSESTEERNILVVGGDPLLHLPLVRDGGTLVGMATDVRTVQEAHRLAKRMGMADRINFYVSDLLSLPFPAARFDAVLCGAVLARSSDDLFILREMTRVLKYGGVLGLTLPSYETAGQLSRYVPESWLVRDLHEPEMVSATGAPLPKAKKNMKERIQQFMRQREGLRRLYKYSRLGTRLDLLGLEVADHGPYLTRFGGMIYESFHTLQALDRRRSFGRWLYALLSPFMIGPILLMDAGSQDDDPGFGLRIAAIKRNDYGHFPRMENQGGGLEIEWYKPSEHVPVPVTPGPVLVPA
jgi:SAM-dependent methyltransferase